MYTIQNCGHISTSLQNCKCIDSEIVKDEKELLKSLSYLNICSYIHRFYIVTLGFKIRREQV